ncbi:Plastocyanin precursor [Legionella lansingensis]|uniref:Plastocyanin n=2 Tax=Legionella lansingensis TaxID=45067 RepID=A0A0W0VF84_9GAMM|nr:cupredoxin domain-containing protein [Legionella lansingensis]KTD18775.1 Plastocyanin precursor [Legionella lansingensis]SNV58730.1 Plastocyanin precursor [Legionella lansingensis]
MLIALTSQPSLAKSANHIVIVRDDYFSPKTLTIKAGEKVTWVNKGSDEHDVKSSDAGFNSGDIAPSSSFSHTFAKPGRYKYICTHHSMLWFGMRGEIIVNNLRL